MMTRAPVCRYENPTSCPAAALYRDTIDGVRYVWSDCGEWPATLMSVDDLRESAREINEYADWLAGKVS
jgi:hypothetical protein